MTSPRRWTVADVYATRHEDGSVVLVNLTTPLSDRICNRRIDEMENPEDGAGDY
jgi:hypothetical protein